MKVTDRFHCIIYLSAFLFLMSCPAVHDLGCAANHEVVVKNGIRTQQREFHQSTARNPVIVLNAFSTAFCNPSLPPAQHSVAPLPVASFHLAVLPTVQLNL